MKTKKPTIAKDKSEIVRNLPKACSDGTAAVEFLEAQRWGDHPACPHCGSLDIYQMKHLMDKSAFSRCSIYTDKDLLVFVVEAIKIKDPTRLASQFVPKSVNA